MTEAELLIHEAEQELRARRLDVALKAFEHAERADSDRDRCSGGRWMAHMLRGDFEKAWLENDAMRQRNSRDPHRLWDGHSLLDKRIMVRCLHGFGDAVQFLRYIPKLRESASRVIIEVAPPLVELAKYFQGVDEVITWGEEAPITGPLWDEQIEVMELPYIFRTAVSDLPLAERYVNIPEQARKRHIEDSGPLQVGLVWTAGEWNKARSVPWPLLGPLFEISNCDFWNLQPSALSECDDLRHDESCQASLVGLARSISRLDLVITVDTLAAHLAGAMGVPAWVMLQHEADWRWMHGREDSPWYPSLRLFRQSEAGDWSSVIEKIGRALESKRDSLRRQLVA